MDTAWPQPHSLPVRSAAPQGCACVGHQWPWVPCFSRWEDTSLGRRVRSTSAARHRLGQGTGWGGSALTALTCCSCRVFILFFITMVANSSGICLGSSTAPHLFLPITLTFFGASFSCAFTQISFSNEQEFLVIIFHFRVRSLFEAIPPLPYLCTVSS